MGRDGIVGRNSLQLFAEFCAITGAEKRANNCSEGRGIRDSENSAGSYCALSRGLKGRRAKPTATVLGRTTSFPLSNEKFLENFPRKESATNYVPRRRVTLTNVASGHRYHCIVAKLSQVKQEVLLTCITYNTSNAFNRLRYLARTTPRKINAVSCPAQSQRLLPFHFLSSIVI